MIEAGEVMPERDLEGFSCDVVEVDERKRPVRWTEARSRSGYPVVQWIAHSQLVDSGNFIFIPHVLCICKDCGERHVLAEIAPPC